MDIQKLRDELDQADMWSAIRGCPDQFTHILTTYGDWKPREPITEPRQVLFLGMGGSAIGGDMVRVWVDRLAAVPMTVVRQYTVPSWVDRETLVVVSSYSGDTEETLSAVQQAAGQGGRVVAIASGGQLAQLSRKSGWDFIEIPVGFQPRAAIGYSVAATAIVLTAFQVLPLDIVGELEEGARVMELEGRQWADPDASENEPLELAQQLVTRLPIIYGVTGTTEALAVRFRGQLAENSKLLASHHLLPEQNHNEIVGLAERLKEIGDPMVVWLLDREDHERIKLRQELSARLAGTKEPLVASQPLEYALSGAGESLIQRNLSLLHRIDWVSYYVALLRGHDPSAIAILTKLKSEMSRS
ncbi:MAG: bifunctional phosphoglucose/phosphomannose isomerase [Fidelibacterota bacterium]|nr:MAG: bifunctional phosphoglucose/phosphomannose isomerase [Candidatus Neomarinimicrobiota bacterium]